MEAIKILFSLVSNLLSLYINVRVIKLFLTPKKSPKIPAPLIYGFVWLFNWYLYYTFSMPLLNLCSMLSGLSISIFVLFDGKFFRRITAIAASIALSFICDDIIWGLYSIPNFLPKSNILGTILSSLLSLILLLLLEYFLNFHKDIPLPKSNYWNIIFLSLCSAILCEIMLFLGNENSFITIMGLCIIFLINISTLFQYDKINEIYKKTIEQKYMEQRISMYENQFEIIKESQQNLRALRHDLKNHLALINQYIQQEDYTQASSYINEIETGLKLSKEYCHTGNTEVDSILNYLLNQAAQLNCDISTKIDVPDEKFMSDFDLNVLLSNLLENAIEALAKTNRRELQIYIKYDKNILYISIYNTFTGEICQTDGVFKTLKPDPAKHGYGIRNIQTIVEKYNGKCLFQTEGNLFKADIILCFDKSI